MEMFDLVLEQIKEKSRSKDTVRNIADRVKHILVHAMPDEYEEIDLTPACMIDAISLIRGKVKKGKSFNPDYLLLQNILKFQRKFYLQIEDVDVNLLLQYRSYISKHKDIYKVICEELDKLEKVKFKYEVNMTMPLVENIDKIRSYCDSLEIAVKSLYKIAISNMVEECKGIGSFLVFHEAVIGNEDAWKEKLLFWSACHEAYTLCHVKGLGKAEAIRELVKSPISKTYQFNIDDMSNATHKLDTFLAEANRLIASASKGTFPY
ncbi:MAG: hypothetical protein HXX11_10085 [Desulfuromonadales bacterium]|nr:hypothetical protein [Desulfuromonadales bacterium]